MNIRCSDLFVRFLCRILKKEMPTKPEKIQKIKKKTLKRIEVIADALDKREKIWDRIDPINCRFRRWVHRKFNENWAIPKVNVGALSRGWTKVISHQKRENFDKKKLETAYNTV